MNETRTHNPQLAKSEIVKGLPAVCGDETKAVEFFEAQRWGDSPRCPHCKSANVYKMISSEGGRNKRFLWRCRDCAEQYTVRIGTVYEDSRLPLRHWAYAFWRASTSKKGVSALEIKRQCQISYKSALFLLNRIRHAMKENPTDGGKFTGTVEVDETYVGGKASNMHADKRAQVVKGTGGIASGKAAVLGMVQREGKIHRRVIADVSAATLRSAIRELVDTQARVITDEHRSYIRLHRFLETHAKDKLKERIAKTTVTLQMSESKHEFAENYRSVFHGATQINFDDLLSDEFGGN